MLKEAVDGRTRRNPAAGFSLALPLMCLVMTSIVATGFGKGKPGPPPPPPNPAIAFAAESNFSNFDIMVMNDDGSNSTIVVPGGQGGQNLANVGPSWSPDGQWLAFCRSDDGVNPAGIYVSSLDGTDLRLVSEQPKGWSRGRCTSWSPNGNWIAFHSSINGAADLFVAAVNWDGGGPHFGNVVQLTDTPGRTEWEPSWAWDSSRLVATVFEEYGIGALMVFDLDMQPQYPQTDCTYQSLPALEPCVIAETSITPAWMTFPREGTWANHHDWIAAGRVDYQDGSGTPQVGMFVIDVSDISSPAVWGPLGYGGHYFNAPAWDPSDQVIALHLQAFQDPGKKGKKTRPEGIYRINLGITSDSSGHIADLMPESPVLLFEGWNGYSWSPAWRP